MVRNNNNSLPSMINIALKAQVTTDNYNFFSLLDVIFSVTVFVINYEFLLRKYTYLTNFIMITKNRLI